ncbi:MAG: CPBP family intramembrane metalloprotease [Proteobacteria bacterium]|nr:CPBP family intramembrane metalloprotease [Pseudomonadota bacterium]
MAILDFIAVFLFALALPLAGYITQKRNFLRLAEGGGKLRIRAYLSNVAILWALLALLAFAWLSAERDFALMGFALPETLRFWGGSALAGIAILPLMYQVRLARKSADYRHQLIEEMGRLEHLLPRAPRELGYFSGLAVTAGIVEEILYRGALIWYLSLWMDTLWAAAIALLVFTLAHAYQGPKNTLRAGLAGLALTVVYLLSGSILPAIMLHAAIDLLGGAMGYYALSMDNDEHGAGAATEAEAETES